MQIVPPQILSYRYKMERSVAFKIRQIRFRPELYLGAFFAGVLDPEYSYYHSQMT